MRSSWLAVVVVVAGCSKSPPPTKPAASIPAPPASTTVQDELWDLAPQGAVAGVIVSPRGLVALENGWRDVRAFIDGSPELAPFATKLDAELAKVFGDNDVVLASAGMSPEGGAAFFIGSEADGNDGDDAGLLLLPVVDRDKFLATAKGEKRADGDVVDDMICKPLGNRYGCAKNPDVFTRISKGNLVRSRKLAGARGEIEVIAYDLDGDSDAQMMLAVQLSRGSLVVRGGVRDPALTMTAQLAAAGKPPIALDKMSSFGVWNVAPLLRLIGDRSRTLAAGLSIDDIISAIGGPLSFWTLNGSTGFEGRVHLANAALVRSLLDRCGDLKLDGVTLTSVNGRCRMREAQYSLDIDVFIEGSDLRLVSTGQGTATSIEPTPIARELASGEWALASYGRGSIAADGELFDIPAELDKASVALAFRIFAVINEVGFGVRAEGDVLRFVASVRTVWANPDDVVAKVLAIPTSALLDRSSVATAKQIAAASPRSPFSDDVRAGAYGPVLPTVTAGFVTSLAILGRERAQDQASAREAMAKMAAFRDAMCACNDADCAQRVANDMTTWSQQMAATTRRPPTMTEADQAEATQLGTEMGQCMQKAMGMNSPKTK